MPTSANTLSSADNKQGIQVIARCAAILRTLSKHPKGLSLAAIAEQVDLPRSTVQRIVNALQDEYFVELMGPGGGFRLGPAIGRLLYQAQADIITLARPYLEALCEQFHESSYLSSQVNDEVIGIDRVIAEQALRIVFPVGASAPLHSTAPGKALLASMDEPCALSLLPKPLTRVTDKTLSLPQLMEELSTIRETGIAFDCEEQLLGVCSFATPICTYLGTFAIGVVLPVSRLSNRRETICKALLECKENIEARIGCKINDTAPD